MPAQAPHQALGLRHAERGADEKRRYSQILQTVDGAEGVVRVEGGENQVAGKGGLDGNLGGFRVADFADEDDVGVLAEQGAQHFRERDAGGVVDLRLVRSGNRVLDRVFDCRDVLLVAEHAVGEQVHERDVQRGSLARTGRAGDEDDAVAHAERGLELAAQVVVPNGAGEAGLGQFLQTSGVQQTHHHLLPERGGDGRDTDVDETFDAAVHVGDSDAAVEGFAALGDIHAALCLDPGDDLDEVGDRDAALEDFEDAVDAEAYAADAVVHRFDVDIGSAAVESLAEPGARLHDYAALARLHVHGERPHHVVFVYRVVADLDAVVDEVDDAVDYSGLHPDKFDGDRARDFLGEDGGHVAVDVGVHVRGGGERGVLLVDEDVERLGAAVVAVGRDAERNETATRHDGDGLAARLVEVGNERVVYDSLQEFVAVGARRDGGVLRPRLLQIDAVEHLGVDFAVHGLHLGDAERRRAGDRRPALSPCIPRAHRFPPFSPMTTHRSVATGRRVSSSILNTTAPGGMNESIISQPPDESGNASRA